MLLRKPYGCLGFIDCLVHLISSSDSPLLCYMPTSTIKETGLAVDSLSF